VKHLVARGAKAAPIPDTEGSELAHLAEGVFRRYGYDLRHFAGSYLRRRLEAAMRWEEVKTLGRFRERLLVSPDLMERLLMSLSGGPRSMFRDADFHRLLRKEIVPVLRTYPFIRVWVPGCSSGSEVYALAVLLTEEGIYDRCRLYATDLSQEAVRKARDGVYPLAAARKWGEAHQEAGGKAPLSEYFHAEEGKAAFSPELRRNMVFAQHNLAVDGSFNEFNLILCRNVLSTLDPAVRRKVHVLIHQSLSMFGYLALGGREVPGGEEAAGWYREMDSRHRIYRKVS
jgi:chemotaxis protein methyltransferase CheR